MNDEELDSDGQVEEDDAKEDANEDGEYRLRGKDCKFVDMSMVQMQSSQER